MKGQQPAWGWNTVALAAHDTCKTEANRGWYLQDCSGTTSLTGRCSSTSRPRSPARPWTPHRCRPAWPQPLGSPHPGKSPPRTPTRPPEAPKAPKTPLTGPHLCRPPPPPGPLAHAITACRVRIWGQGITLLESQTSWIRGGESNLGGVVKYCSCTRRY